MAQMAGSLIGGVSSGVSARYQAAQSWQAAKHQGRLLRSAADRAEGEGETRAKRIRAMARRATASQRTKLASAGVDLSGTGFDVQHDTALQFGVDAFTQEYMGYVEGQNLRNKAYTVEQSGKNAMTSVWFGGSKDGSAVSSGADYFSNRPAATTGTTTAVSSGSTALSGSSNSAGAPSFK